MGTRNLTAVYLDGKHRVAQYGQFDGYPEGQGMTVLDFARRLADPNTRATFEQKLGKCQFVSIDEIKKIITDAGFSTTMMTFEDAKRFKKVESLRPFNREAAAEILDLVLRAETPRILLQDSLTFAGDSLFCEWGYVLDLDTNRLEVYRGFNTRPLAKEERFHGVEKDNPKYEPIYLLKAYPLTDLPSNSQFLEDLKEQGEE